MIKNEFSLSPKMIVTPYDILEDYSISLKKDRISKLQKLQKDEPVDYLLDDFIIYPSLINAHDHLLGSYFPRVGDRRPYLNWKDWDDDLKSSPIYAERGKSENIDMYYLGSYRNLISGVLTVSDHIPHVVNDPFISLMPIRVLKNYSLAHEVSDYDLKWGDGVEVEYEKALKNDEPFITHIEEGFDEESGRGIDHLLDMNALGEHTVLIHGIALSDKDIDVMAENKANLVWCPFSNHYMFERTARAKEIIKAGVNVSIGTDSPMSGSLNILEEMRFAKKIYYDMYRETLPDSQIVRMVTINPALALRLSQDLGSLEVGKKGDFVGIRDKDKNPYTLLVEAELEDIAIMFYNGRPIYGDQDFSDLFDTFQVDYSKFRLNNIDKIIAGNNPLDLLKKIRKAVGFEKEIPFLPIG